MVVGWLLFVFVARQYSTKHVARNCCLQCSKTPGGVPRLAPPSSDCCVGAAPDLTLPEMVSLYPGSGVLPRIQSYHRNQLFMTRVLDHAKRFLCLMSHCVNPGGLNFAVMDACLQNEPTACVS